jgi:hypothetical protein
MNGMWKGIEEEMRRRMRGEKREDKIREGE